MKRFVPLVRLAAVITLLLNAIWLSPAGANTAPQIAWLGELSGGDLASPRMLAVDGEGNLYVADQVARAVLKFDRYGRPVSTFLAGQASGKGVAVTPDGKILYVATRKQGVVIVNTADGTVAGVLAGTDLKSPAEIKLDAAGYIYVADAGAGQPRIKVFYPNGTFKAQFGGLGRTNGLFTSIGALAIEPLTGKVHVGSDIAELPRLQIFSAEGAFLASVTNATLYGVDNHSARGIAFDGNVNGRAYVLRYVPAALRVFNGTFTALLGDFGNLAGKLAAPVDVVYEPVTRRLFISNGPRVEIFGIDGATSPVRVNQAPSAPAPVAPVAGTVVADAAPTLAWSAASDPDGDALTYAVVVKKADVTVYSATTAATSLSIPAGVLTENSSYTWTVQANDAESSSASSAPATFVLNAVNEPPTTPTPIAPLAGEGLGDDGLLAWSPSSDPDPNDFEISYLLEIAADPTFAQPTAVERLTATTLALAELTDYDRLVPGTTYSWRVVASDRIGAASAPSAAGRFVYRSATLQVSSNPAGASVYLYGNHGFAGQFVGVTPLELRNVEAGSLAVVIESPGFEPFVQSTVVSAETGAAVSATLIPGYKEAAFRAGTINGKNGIAAGAGAAPVLVDFDNDGRLDLLVGDGSGQLSLFAAMTPGGPGKLSVQPRAGLGLPVLPGAVPFVADWNNDGRKDLLVGVAGGTVELFLNTGSDTAPVFAAGQALVAGGSVLSVGSGAAPVVVDLNGDGLKDIIVGNAAGNIVVCLNQGSDAAPQLAAAAPLFRVGGAVRLTSVDWNEDGSRDLLVTAGGATRVYLNDLAVSGAFVPAETLPVAGVYGIAAIDLDGVGGKDLLVGQADGRLTYWTGGAQLYADAALAALLGAWDEITLQLATANPASLTQAGKVRTELAAGRYAKARNAALTLAAALPAGEERTAVELFAALLR